MDFDVIEGLEMWLNMFLIPKRAKIPDSTQ